MIEVDLFHVSLAVLVLTIAAFIVRAVRLTNASISTASRHLNLARPDVARRVTEEIRARQVPCGRCGQTTFALLGTETRYKCDTCQFELEGPAHIPPDVRGDY